ncbi:MAG: lipocalin family protein [Pseudomonas sp.]
MHRYIHRSMTWLACLVVLSGCAGSTQQPPQTVQVDLKRYEGTWYELARKPMFFQRQCTQSEAHYQLQPDSSIAVTNRCLTTDGDWDQATGRAEAQVPGRTDKLWVRFDNTFTKLFPGIAKGDYWVLYVDDDYQTALVGNPNREYLWLLSRQPVVPDATRQKLLELAHARGYQTDDLIWRAADSSPTTQ